MDRGDCLEESLMLDIFFVVEMLIFNSHLLKEVAWLRHRRLSDVKCCFDLITAKSAGPLPTDMMPELKL